jgi:diacylglycerol kinase (ATP)
MSAPSKTSRRALLLVNPHARRGSERLDPIIARLAAGGIAVTQEQFTAPTEVSPDIIRLSPGHDLVIVCGGDGTLNAAAQGIMMIGLPMGILPMGTANDLARTLGIPNDLARAADIIIAGKSRRIDLGEVNGHPFFNVASLGLSAELARGLTRDMKRRWGRIGYALAALRVLASARPFRAQIVSGTSVVRVTTMQIAVGNGRYYGGGMAVESNARIDDHHLDLYSLEVSSVWKLALMLRSFRRGAHGAWREVRTGRAQEFDIRTRRPRPINTDGELVTFTPARFRVVPAALEVFTP